MIKRDKGISLVELLVGAAILTMFIVALVVVFQNFLVQSFNSVEKVQASYLAEEGIEVFKALRDDGWEENIADLEEGTVYYLNFSDGAWQLVSSQPALIEGSFDRALIIEEVYRDGSDDISDSGTVDPNTKKVSVSVSWLQGNATTTNVVSTYVTNFHE